MTAYSVYLLGVILLTASLVAIVARRLKLPYTVGLVLAGIGLAQFPIGADLPLTRDLIFDIFLPPLIFEAALHLKWRSFFRNLPLTGTLAFLGVIVSAIFVAAGMHYLIGWSWIGAELFGTLIAATDPVSVIAAFRELEVDPRLRLVMESESLLNDGAAAVGFVLLAAIATGAGAAPLAIAGSLAWTVLGGISVGLGVAGAMLLIAGRTEDHLVEVTLTTISAYGSFLLAEHFHMSGVLATLAAGLLLGNVGLMRVISQLGQDQVLDFWNYAAFVANSIVFVLIGTRVASQPISLVSGAALTAIALVLAGRVLAVYPIAALFRPTRLRISLKYQHVLVWGGLRGAIALALALALPEQVHEQQAISLVAFAVVAFSTLVQGLSMPWLIRRLDLAPDEVEAESEISWR